VRAENKNRAVRNFVNGLDKNGATAAKLFDDVGVVHDFVVHIDGISVGFQGQFDDIHCANYASAKAARPDSQKHFSFGLQSASSS